MRLTLSSLFYVSHKQQEKFELGFQGDVNIGSACGNGVAAKDELLKSLLVHPAIRNIYSAGLIITIQFENAEVGQKIIHKCVGNGLITDWLLFAADCMRIAPLIITDEMIQQVCKTILQGIAEMVG